MSHSDTAVQKTYECDVLVIGAGVSGYCAAIQAGRRGCRTILLEKDNVLGGNAGPNLGVGITGAERYSAYAVETGIIQELREESCWADAYTHTGRGAMGYSISRRAEAVVQGALEKAGVRLLKLHYARRPIMDGNRIAGVIAEDLAAFQTVQIDVSGCVIEASGDGEIGALAGADFDFGSESKSEFGERSAPQERNNLVQGTSLVGIGHRTLDEVVFIPPDGTPGFIPRVWHGRMSSFLRHHDGWLNRESGMMFLYVTETGGHMDTVRDDAQIYEMLLKQLWAEWDHIKNGPHREEARNWDILWVSPKGGKRESRRFLGDYILTQTDLEAGRCFDDDVTYGGHDLDDHRPLGEGSNIYAFSIPPLYGVPFRCCYSRNIGNLFLGGRLISATHLAHSSTRIMGTGAAVGQAVGLAAALCIEHGCTPRELGAEHISQLQSELQREDATLLHRPVLDAEDLGRKARVQADSEMRFNDQQPGQQIPLIAPAGIVLWDWPEKLDQAELHLRNCSERDQTLDFSILRTRREPKWKSVDEYHSVGWNDMSDEALRRLHTVQATVPAGFEGWFPVDLGGFEPGPKDAASDDDRLLITVSENPEVRWAVAEGSCEIAEMVEHSHHSPKWSPMGCMGTLRLTPAPMLGEAVNVTNGLNRRFSRAPLNMWMSDPGQDLPQSLELEWDEPQTFTRVRLAFDTLHRSMHDYPWEYGKRASEMCVRDYSLSALTDAGWVCLVQVSGNFRRRRDHEFEPITARKLRLTVLGTHSEAFGARVYQMSVFD